MKLQRIDSLLLAVLGGVTRIDAQAYYSTLDDTWKLQALSMLFSLRRPVRCWPPTQPIWGSGSRIR